MSILDVSNVSHGFGSRKILEDVFFLFLIGKNVGFLGATGEENSIFLILFTGKMIPDEGDVKWCNHITTGYLDQFSTLEKGKSIRDILRTAFAHMFELEAEMMGLYEKMGNCDPEEMDAILEEVGEIQTILDSGDFYNLDSKIEEYASGLGLMEIGLDRDVTELSGGQRAKILLAKVLLENPMILILDEPTNFLDENHIEWLKKFLQEYENAFILVSHDIPFLNDVTNVIYHIENAVLTRYTGDYYQFQEMYALKKRQIEQAYKKQQKEIDNLKDFIARNKARVATTNLAKDRQKKLDKMDIIEIAREKIKPSFAFQTARTPSREVVAVKDLVIGYDEPLTKALNFSIERNQKIAIRGVNGLGKSTLLNTILGAIKPVSGEVEHGQFLEVGYFKQEVESSSTTALDEIWNEFPSMTNGEVRSALAKCGLNNDHITSQMKVLSGGENAKVRLCKLMLRDINFLVLDEPTNHLDVDAKEELKKAVREFKGTVLLVSHEPDFYMDIVTDIWNVEDWTTKVV